MDLGEFNQDREEDSSHFTGENVVEDDHAAPDLMESEGASAAVAVSGGGGGDGVYSLDSRVTIATTDKYPQYVGWSGNITKVPAYPSTWYDVRFDDGSIVKFRSSSFAGDNVVGEKGRRPRAPNRKSDAASKIHGSNGGGTVAKVLYDFREPLSVEANGSLGPALVGSRVSIYWDGDAVFYPARIVAWEQLTAATDTIGGSSSGGETNVGKSAGDDSMQSDSNSLEEASVVFAYKVMYEGDENGDILFESLTNNTTVWKIFAKNNEEGSRWDPSVDGEAIINSEADLTRVVGFAAKPGRKPRSHNPNVKPRASRTKKAQEDSLTGGGIGGGGEMKETKEVKPRAPAKMTFQQMVLQAVTVLDEKGGSTLQAIRKYMNINFQEHLKKDMSVTAFNSMTLKAIQKCMGAEELENPKGHHYKVHPREKKRRLDAIKEAEREAHRRATGYYDKVYYEKEERASGGGGGGYQYQKVGNLNGTMNLQIFETNKTLGKQKEALKEKRDKHLLRHYNTLRAFLHERNYFWKKEMRNIRDNEAAVAIQSSSDRNSNSNGSSGGNDNSSIMSIENDNKNSESYENLDLGASSAAAVAGEILVTEERLDVMATDENVAESSTSREDVHQEDGNIDGNVVVNDEKSERPKRNLEKHNADPKKNPWSVIDPNSELLKNAGKIEEIDPLQDVKMLKANDFPKTLTAKLLPHQISGISFMLHQCQRGLPVLLGDAMGLGKTLQTIGFITMWLENFKPKGPFLVICPLSVLSNWQNEFARFNPSIRCVRFHGVKAERIRLKAEELFDKAEFDVVLTSYEVLVSEIMFFRRKCVWTAVIIDEAHRLKNNSSQFSSKLLLVPCLHKVLLTGTPLQNNLKELWALLHFMSPDIFSNDTAENFENAFDLLRNKFDHSLMLRAHQLLRIFMLRRIKEDVNLHLPSKKEVTLLVPLTDEQINWYRALLSENMDENIIEVIMNEDPSNPSVGGGGGASKASSSGALSSEGNKSEGSNNADWKRLMNLLLQLRKVCNHTSLMPSSAEDYGNNDGGSEDGDGNRKEVVKTKEQVLNELLQGSGKMVMLDRILFRLKDNNHKVLIFSQFTSMLDVLEDFCDCKGYNYVRLDGNTNRVQRRLNCRRFNAINSTGSNIFIFLISTRAGGLGLNLTAADTVILYDSDWNPQVDLQAMERCHRIGQTKPVRIYRLICKGSVEERMVSRASKKLFLNAVVAENPVNNLLSGKIPSSAAAISRTSSVTTMNSDDAMNIDGEKLRDDSKKGGSAIPKKEGKDSKTKEKDENIDEDHDDVDNFDNVDDAADDDEDDNGGDDDMMQQLGVASTKAPSKLSGMEEEEPVLPSVENDNAIENALGIGGGATISKQELFSLIRFGTNAIIDNYDSLTDKELDKFLEIRGRDLPSEPELPGEVIASSSKGGEDLKEVDLRQLGDSIFVKKKSNNKMVGAVSEKNIVKSNSDGNWADSNAPPTKRVRVERIVYVDGKGSGYGGDIPMLKCNMHLMDDEKAAVSINTSKLRRKDWINQDFCCICGTQPGATTAAVASEGGVADGGAVFSCGYCPKTYHWNCLEQTGILNGYNMHITFSCPHHRCSVCNRTTATAGGMLFRCYDCMTALCEDCLEPYYDLDNFEFNNNASSTGDSDCYTGGLDMESMGRFSSLERLGYKSSQAFYIRCTNCSESNAKLVELKNSSSSSFISSPVKAKSKPAEVNVNDIIGSDTSSMDVVGGGDVTSGVVEGGEETQPTPLLLSQLVKVYNQAKIVAPPKEDKGKKRSIKSAKEDDKKNVRVETFKHFLIRKSDYFKTLHQVLTELLNLLPELLSHTAPLLSADSRFPPLSINASSSSSSSSSSGGGASMLRSTSTTIQTVLQKQSVSSYTFMLSALVTKLESNRIRGVQNFVSDVGNLIKGVRDILSKELKNRQKLLKDSIESQNRNLETSCHKDISFIESRAESLARLLEELSDKSDNITIIA